ncbi:MAG: sulfatase, partial [Verrucomicrobia bacterium]|nr:sulfatase [Verrucomicrobiota bacterium]
TPDPSFKWDFVHDYAELGAGRSPKKYHDYAEEFFARSKSQNKPFYFMVNSHDPHRPFYDPEGRGKNGEEVPSRLFKPEEVVVPPYLPDLPKVRIEYSHYLNSVRRLDDTVGRVLQALEDSGLAGNTMVVFITDNGSSFPFAKANTYVASNRTPMLVRWPGITKPGSVDKTHFVSEVDFFATFMDATGLPLPAGLDGRSLVPLLKGGDQAGRDFVFTQIDYTIGGPAKPMRCQARVEMFRHRVPQELYDLQKDPGCLKNLIQDPSQQAVAKKYQDRLRQWMIETHDHCLAAFDVRGNPAQLAKAVANYPSLDKSGGLATEAGEEGEAKPSGGDDKVAKRKANRTPTKATR